MKKELLIGIAIGAGAVALFAGASASSLLFGALILACPLTMLFMHGGHGGHGGHERHGGEGDHTGHGDQRVDVEVGNVKES